MESQNYLIHEDSEGFDTGFKILENIYFPNIDINEMTIPEIAGKIRSVLQRISFVIDPEGENTDDLVQEGILNFITKLNSSVVQLNMDVVLRALDGSVLKMKEYLDSINESTIHIHPVIQPDSLESTLDSPDVNIERAEFREKLNGLLKRFPPGIRSMFLLSVGLNDECNETDCLTESEIGIIYNISRQRVSQLIMQVKEELLNRGIKFLLGKEDEYEKFQYREEQVILDRHIAAEKVEREQNAKPSLPETRTIRTIKQKSTVIINDDVSIKVLKCDDDGVVLLQINGETVEAVTLNYLREHFFVNDLNKKIEAKKIKPIERVIFTRRPKRIKVPLYRRSDFNEICTPEQKKHSQKLKIEPDAKNIEFVRITDDGLIIVKIDNEEVVLESVHHRAQATGIIKDLIIKELETCNFKPQKGVKVHTRSAAFLSPLYQKELLDKVVESLMTEQKICIDPSCTDIELIDISNDGIVTLKIGDEEIEAMSIAQCAEMHQVERQSLFAYLKSKRIILEPIEKVKLRLTRDNRANLIQLYKKEEIEQVIKEMSLR